MSETEAQSPGVVDVSTMDPDEARRQKSLNLMLVAAALGALFLLLVALAIAPMGLAGDRSEVGNLILSCIVALLGTSVLFVLNRYVSVGLASTLFLLLMVVTVAFSDEPMRVVNGRGLLSFAFPIVAASALLRPSSSLILAGVCSLVIVGLGLEIPGHAPNLAAILSFFVVALVSWLLAQGLARTLSDFRALNRELNRRVEERSRQLEDAREELVRQEKLAVLGQVAGNMSHELRNPLGAITNAAYLLTMILKDPEPDVRTALEVLDKEVGRSTRIVNGLLDYTRTGPPVRGQVDLDGVVRRALARSDVPATVEVVCRLASPAPIRSDPNQLEVVLGNLIRNGVEAMPEGGRLVIETSDVEVSGGSRASGPEPEWVSASVTDTGVGIPEANLEKVFEPLFTTKTHGIGIGLALVKTLVEGHGGHIEVESKVGKGSTFRVMLPIQEGAS